jgi:hypothetical protein
MSLSCWVYQHTVVEKAPDSLSGTSAGEQLYVMLLSLQAADRTADSYQHEQRSAALDSLAV